MAGRTKLKECTKCKKLFVLDVQKSKSEYTCDLCSEIWVAKTLGPRAKNKARIKALRAKEPERKASVEARLAAEAEKRAALVRASAQWARLAAAAKERVRLAAEEKERAAVDRAAAQTASALRKKEDKDRLREKREVVRLERQAIKASIQAQAREKREVARLERQANKQLGMDFFQIMKVFGLNPRKPRVRARAYSQIKHLASIITPTPEKEHETLIWVCSVLKTYTK